MTTLTIQIPENEIDAIKTISGIINRVGGKIEIDNGDLSQKEFELLQESFKEALIIKDGLKSGIPVSDLWNE